MKFVLLLMKFHFRAIVQRRTATTLGTFITSTTVGDVCVRNCLKMISELSPQFPCSQEAYRITHAAVEELKERASVPEDIRQLVYAAGRALNSSTYNPDKEKQQAEDAEEGEVSFGDGAGGHGGGGAGNAPHVRGRGTAMADAAVGYKRGREGGDGGRGGPGPRGGGMTRGSNVR